MEYYGTRDNAPRIWALFHGRKGSKFLRNEQEPEESRGCPGLEPI